MSDSTWPPAPLRWPPAGLTDGVAALDRPRADDAAAIAEACADPAIQRWLPLPDPYTIDDARAFLRALDGAARRGERLVFALRPAGEAALAGTLALAATDLYPRGVVGIGYWTHAAFRRRGLTWRGVRLVARWAAESVAGLRRVEILCQPDNWPSRHVALRAGATFEGTRRAGLVLRGRGVFDAAVYAFTPGDLAALEVGAGGLSEAADPQSGHRRSPLRDPPRFGTLPAGESAVARPGAYAVVLDREQRVLLIRWRGRYFLPGGGIRADEPPEVALGRELLEETGRPLASAASLGRARQYATDRTGRWLDKHCTFFLAEVADAVCEPTEPDHHVEWVPLARAGALLHEEASAWAIAQAVRRAGA